MENNILLKFVAPIVIFLILFVIGKLIYNKVSNSNSRFLNPTEYLPEEEVQTLKQVFYLIMMMALFVFILYYAVIQGHDMVSLAVLEIIVTLYIAITLDYSSWKNRILFIFLIPFGSIVFLAQFSPSEIQDTLMIILYIFHIIVYLYLMKMYYDKFREYTKTNGLGITIILLFVIIFVSFIITTIVENTEPLNAMVMVSNAFTSNGYAVLGTSSAGKLNSLVLVWGGYILSGAGTATLTAAIILRHTHKREKELNQRLDQLEELIKNNRE